MEGIRNTREKDAGKHEILRMRQSSSSMMTLNSLSETPSVRNASVGTGTRRNLESLTAVEKDALGKLAHLCPVLLKHILMFTQQSPFCQ